MIEKRRLVQVSGKLDDKLGGPVTAFKGTLPFITKYFETDLLVFGSHSLDLISYNSVQTHATFLDNRYGLSFRKTAKKILQIVDSANLILIHGFYLASTIRVLRISPQLTPIFIMPHGSLESHQEKENRFSKYLFKKIFNLVTSKKRVVFITATYKEAANISKIFPSNRVEVVGIGVSQVHRTNQNSKRDNVLLVAGRIHRVKRIDVAIEAFKKIAHVYPEFKLHIVGSGDRRLTRRLIKLAEEYVLRERILFIPHLSNSDVRNRLSLAKVLMNCSDNENFSITSAEATCEGTPVLTSEKTGFSEFINIHKSGVVTLDNTADLLSQGIREILSRWDYYHENCLENSELLRWEKVFANWLTVLTKEA